MTGNIKGEMDMKQVVANSQGGVTGLLSTIGSKVPVVKEMITKAQGFTLTTGHRHGGENPKEFYLYGKKKGDKDWTLVYHADQSHLPDKAFTDKYYEIPSADRHDFSEWRFEITKVYGGDKQDYMSLGEFTFEYDK